jgi:hypothetical protein
MSVFERTLVRSTALMLGACDSSVLCVRTCRVSSDACVHECVCVMGCCGRTHEGEFVSSPVYTFERTRYVRTQSAKNILFYYFFLQK